MKLLIIAWIISIELWLFVVIWPTPVQLNGYDYYCNTSIVIRDQHLTNQIIKIPTNCSSVFIDHCYFEMTGTNQNSIEYR